jgi:hypothetical protein
MWEDDDALYTIFVFWPLWMLICYGIGWCLGWGVEAIFIGEPYDTAIGLNLKTFSGIVIGVWWGILKGFVTLVETYK